MKRQETTARGDDAGQAGGSESWLERLRDLPDLRWAKVSSARRRIGARLYERESSLDAILQPVANDVGVSLGDDTVGDAA